MNPFAALIIRFDEALERFVRTEKLAIALRRSGDSIQDFEFKSGLGVGDTALALIYPRENVSVLNAIDTYIAKHLPEAASC